MHLNAPLLDLCCVCAHKCTHATTYVWKSEDNVQVSVFCCVGSEASKTLNSTEPIYLFSFLCYAED